MEISLGPPFVVNVFVKTFFIFNKIKGQIKFIFMRKRNSNTVVIPFIYAFKVLNESFLSMRLSNGKT